MSKVDSISWCVGDRAAPGGPVTPARAPAAAVEGAQSASGGHSSEPAAQDDPYSPRKVCHTFTFAVTQAHSSCSKLGCNISS